MGLLWRIRGKNSTIPILEHRDAGKGLPARCSNESMDGLLQASAFQALVSTQWALRTVLPSSPGT